MLESIVVALITGILSIIGVVITVVNENKKTTAKMEVNQAVTDTKIDELTREVREHNHFAQTIPVMQEQIRSLNDRVSVMEHTAVQRKV